MDERNRRIARLERWHSILAHVAIGLCALIALCQIARIVLFIAGVR